MVEFQAVLAATIAGAFVFGMVLVLLGCVKAQLAGRLRVPERQVTGLWAGMNLILVPMAFLGGLLVDAWDVRWVFLLGCLIIAFALVLLLIASTFRGALFAFLLTGVGAGFLGTACIVLMPCVFFGPHESSASLNLGNVFFALGALIAPLLAQVLLLASGYRRTLGVAAVACLLPATLIVFAGEEVLPAEEHEVHLWALLSDPWLWMAGLVFFLYAPLEGCLHTWGSTYLQNMGHRERNANALISGFWSCFLLGRLATAYLQHQRLVPETWDTWVLIFLSVGAMATLANMAGTARKSGATTGLLLLGFFLGPIFPTLIGLLFNRYPDGQGTAFGTMFAIGSAGSVVFAPIIGARFHQSSAQRALRIPLALSVLLMLAGLLFALGL